MAVFATAELSEIQYDRLRGDVGASATLITDPIAEAYFVEAQEQFPTNTAKMIAQARVIALRRIRASAAMLGKYAQNQSEEDLTKVFDNLTIMLGDAEKAVSSAQEVVTDDSSHPSPYFFGVASGRRGR